ncbi:hypothetical protein GALMADRAFT_72750 [Galerina marginata CBS 339.88]|uniref:FAR-17a/AIG1-like protein n=1 Tax=Galerina marginata (strain CBS 339.88) TaxID=685588 RepID=A0A067SQZ2_GALM3|nr:hypothetical protein GALMADRAFT_72750 [Galerina marginata CBS 339.88]
MARLNLYSRLGVPATFDREHKYVTSPIFRSPLTLALLRTTIALYTLVVLLVTLIWKVTKEHDGQSYFSFFTYLTYTGLCAYYFASSTQTISYALRWRKGGAGAGYPLQRWSKILQALHVILQSTIITFPILVTVVFWVLLADPSTFGTLFSSWSNISVHALNTLFALVEILLTNSPPAPWLTLIPCLLVMVGYLGVAYITHATQGIYTYSFLDPHKQGAKLAAYIVGIAVGEIIVFSLVRGVVVLRERWAVKAGRVLALPEDRPEDDGDDWEHIESPITGHKTSEV